MADSLVFDFPDPTPHFDFDNFSHGGISSGGLSNASSSRDGSSAAAANNANAVNISSSSKKNSSKKSGRALFKSRFMNKKSQQQQRPASPVPEAQRSNNDGDHSPLNKSMGDQSGTTATTASLSVGSGSFSPGRMQSSSSAAVVTPATPPPPPNNHSNTNTTAGGRESPRFEFTLFDDTSPSPKSSHSGMRKSLLTKQPNPYSNLTATTTNTSHSQLNSQENNLYTTSYGLSSDRTAASGYISEVSEFSFDRVTVTTERTGMSSNVSWNFMDNTDGHLNVHDLIGSGGGSGDDDGGGILGALGGTTATGGRGGGSSKLIPPDIDNLLLDNDDDLLHHHDDDGGGPHHHPNRNRMNVFTGEIHKCDQSVISEISEGIDGHDDPPHHGNGNGMDFINSLLLEKYNDDDDAGDEGGKGVNVPSLRPRSSTQKQQEQQQKVATATPLQKQSSSNNNTISTVSTSATNSGGESVYDRYKQHRQQQHQQQRNNNSNSSSIKGNKPTQTKRSIFKAIMEDIQFCGMYFCGLDTTVADDGQLTDNDTKKKDLLRSSGGGGSPGGGNSRSKEARKKEMDSTFLGKFVNCANCGPEM